MHNALAWDVQSIYIGGFVIANKDIPADIRYKYLYAIYGRDTKEGKKVISAKEDIKIENAIGGKESESYASARDLKNSIKKKAS